MKWNRISVSRWRLYGETGDTGGPCAHLDWIQIVRVSGSMRKRRRLDGTQLQRFWVVGVWHEHHRASTILGAHRSLDAAKKTAEAACRLEGWK